MRFGVRVEAHRQLYETGAGARAMIGGLKNDDQDQQLTGKWLEDDRDDYRRKSEHRNHNGMRLKGCS